MTDPTTEATPFTETDATEQSITKQKITVSYDVDWKTEARTRFDMPSHFRKVKASYTRTREHEGPWSPWAGSVEAFGVNLLKNGKAGKKLTTLRIWSAYAGLLGNLPEWTADLVTNAEARRDELAA